MTLKGRKNHYNVKLLRGYGVSISLKNNKIILRNGRDVLSGKVDNEEWFVTKLPYEKIVVSGRVLWITLKSSWFSPKNPPVTSVLLSIQGNINYDENYGYVRVKNLNNINYFLQNKEEQFSEKEVNRLIGRIKGDITK